MKLDFLIYSSHKTSTQSMLSILNANNYKAVHCHIIQNLQHFLDEKIITKDIFIKYLEKYKYDNKTPLKIITIIRDPKTRLVSSFFQSSHNREIRFGIKKEETTISKNNVDELIKIFNNKIENNSILPHGKIESIDEMSEIFKFNIIKNLEKKNDYYYLKHSLFQLFVLDFNKLIQKDNIHYINRILNINCSINKKENLSINKYYYNKYKIFKTKIHNKTINIIVSRYNLFYFNAFL
jgi:hypothetical protein